MVDVMGGHTNVMFSSLVQTTPNIKSGKLRALGVGGTERSKILPDVPTIAEAGVPGYAVGELVGHRRAGRNAGADRREAAPGAGPKAQDNPQAQKYFDTEGATIVKMSTAEFGKFMVSEMNKWERVVKEGHIKAE